MGNKISYNRENGGNLKRLKCHICPKSSFDDFKSLRRHVLEDHIVEKAEEAERKEHNEVFESDKNENVVSKKRKNGHFNEDTTPPASVKKPRASLRRQSSESPNDENACNDLSVSKNETPPTGEKKTKPRRNSSLKDSDVSTLQSDSPTVGNRRRLSPRNRSESESPNELDVVAKPRTTRRKQSEESESSSKHDSSLATDKSESTTPKTKSSHSPKSHNDVSNAFSSSAKKLNRLLDDEKSKPSLSKDAIVKKLKDMTDEDFIKYNIGEKYDEMEIYRRARLLTPNDDCIKIDEFKTGKVAWAQWRKIWWPCVIEKYWKSDSKSKNKVVIRYYEHENGLSPIFKLDPIKVELFFRSKDHFNLKTLAPIYEERRYDFFVCYTSALEDFVEDLENEERLMAEKTQNQAAAKSDRRSSENGRKTVDATPLKSADTVDENANKRCIEGKWYTIEEIKAIATGPNSKQMEKVIKKREEYSQKLIKLVKSQECKDHLCATMNETKECERHEKYKSSDARTRRKELAFVATGPLVLTHQTELVNMLKEICPASHDLMHRFSTYDYDVLYPEAVIWALQKMHRTTYARAEARYKSGFELDDEERLKHTCNRIINEENEKEAIAAKEAAPKTSPKSHDSSNVSSLSEMSNANNDNGDLSSEESFPMLDI